MTGLDKTMGAMDPGSTRRAYGTAHWDGSRWYARIQDSLLDARWLDPIQPLQGGKIVIDITNDGRGQSTALVIGGYTDQPRPSTGIVSEVIPAGVSTRLVFTGEDGVEYVTDRFIGSYNPGDPVYVTWDAARPTIIGAIAESVPPAQFEEQAPMPGSSGSVTLVATASDTFGVGGWGRWASSQNGGEDVYSGSQGGYTVTGSWFYGAPKPELAGKAITGIRFKVPPRLSVGAHSADAMIHIYAHTSGARPGGDVSRPVGPHDVSIPARFGGGFIDLPLSFGPVLAAGGGISIAGNPYVGFASRLDNPENGMILTTWSS